MRNLLSLTLIFLVNLVIQSSAMGQTSQQDSLAINRLPSIPFLPDPLILDEGEKNNPVTTPAQWRQKQRWISEQYQYWVSGSFPAAPKTFRARVVNEKIEDGVKLRTVELTFGPDDRAKMTLELMIPLLPGRLPVYLTQWNHRGWAQVAVRRGYIGCIYAGADMKDDTRNYNEVFTGYDFATLMKRAWGGSRAIDYLHTLPEVDTARIGMTGHSRNGKQALMAAAFDPRIKAVISSSGGTGGESTFRWSDYRFTPGSFDRMITSQPDWFSHRMPGFIGREEKLPADQNSLMSLIAPRGLMLYSAITEDEGNPWGIEQSYLSVKKVYQFLKADKNIAIHLRAGRHQHTARDAENFVDFFDYIFGRSRIAPENKLYYNYSFDEWKKKSGERINPTDFPVTSGTFLSRFEGNKFTEQQRNVREKIKWLLGEEPAGVKEKTPFSHGLTKNRTYPNDYLEEVIGEPALPSTIKRMTIGPYFPVGDDLWASLYVPASNVIKDSIAGKLPLVIYLHEHTYATGFHKKSIPVIRKVVEQGFAVLALDMIGFGTRIEEPLYFYDRYPRWSLMGKMVTDTRSVVHDAYYRMPFINSSRIYVSGYSLGGTVALLTAALDTRVKGAAVVSAFSSLRNDNKVTEGIKHYSHLHGLLPKLGFFVGHEANIPIDFDDILASIAPRPVLVLAPKKDGDHSISSVQQMVLNASRPGENNLTLKQPDTYNYFSDSLQKNVAEWFLKTREKAAY